MRATGATLFGLTEYRVYSSTSIADYLGQRTRFLDDALRRSLETVEQVVILGAGWDTRAYNLVRERDVRVYEVDLAHMQAIKREVLANAQIDTSGVVFCPADLVQEPWLEALKQVGFDPGLPAFVLWEGVSYYMTQASVEATLRTVATGLASGSAIAFDYFSRHYVEGGEFSLLPWPFAAFFRWIGEPHVFGLPTEAPARARLAAFLAEKDLRLVEFEPIGAGAREPAGAVHSQRVRGATTDYLLVAGCRLPVCVLPAPQGLNSQSGQREQKGTIDHRLGPQGQSPATGHKVGRRQYGDPGMPVAPLHQEIAQAGQGILHGTG